MSNQAWLTGRCVTRGSPPEEADAVPGDEHAGQLCQPGHQIPQGGMREDDPADAHGEWHSQAVADDIRRNEDQESKD